MTTLISTAEKISQDVLWQEKKDYNQFDRKLDRLFTNRLTGYPTMLLLLALIFWITITGANVISELLSGVLFFVQDQLTAFFQSVHAPDWLHGVLVLGMYRVLAWVVSVMLHHASYHKKRNRQLEMDFRCRCPSHRCRNFMLYSFYGRQ